MKNLLKKCINKKKFARSIAFYLSLFLCCFQIVFSFEFIQPTKIQSVWLLFTSAVMSGTFFLTKPNRIQKSLGLEDIPIPSAIFNKKGHFLEFNSLFDLEFSTSTKHPCWEKNIEKIKLLLLSHPRYPQLLYLSSLTKSSEQYLCALTHLSDQRKLLTCIKLDSYLTKPDIFEDWKSCVSHQLYTPLTSIKGFANILSKKYPDQALHTIQETSEKLIESLRMFLQQEKTIKGSFSQVDLAALIQKYLDYFKPLFETDLDPPLFINSTEKSIVLLNKSVCTELIKLLILDIINGHLQSKKMCLQETQTNYSLNIFTKSIPLHLPIYQNLCEILNAHLVLQANLTDFNLVFTLSKTHQNTSQQTSSNKTSTI